ncbi:MAG: GNAT family N-acetyltransferase [Ktedonobacterales bacterium]
MQFSFHPMDRISAAAIVTWHYEPPYDFYDCGSDGEDETTAMIDPTNQFVAIRERKLGLVAFCSFGLDGQVPGGDYSAEALDLGLGIRPDLTGHGWGSTFVAAVIAQAETTHTPKRLRVTIAEFNQRARLVWERAGFHFVQRFLAEVNETPFIILIRDEMP